MAIPKHLMEAKICNPETCKLANTIPSDNDSQKMVAQLVVENADMQKRIYETIKYMQNKYDNSDLCGFTISFNEFEELKKALKGD